MEINKTSRTSLKDYFKKYNIPTEAQFAEILEGMFSQKDDGIAKLEGQPLAVKSEGTEQNLISFYKTFDDQNPTWVWSQNAGGVAGFNFAEASGVSRLFIGKNTGSVGINTNTPAKKLHVEEGELYMKAAQNVADELAVFLNKDADKGISISSDCVASAGDTADQDILLMPKGDGQVGIGTDSPAAMLDIRGNMTIQDDFTVTYGLGGNNLIKVYYDENSDNIIDLYSGGNEKVRIHSAGDSFFNAGNVGIGTNSPSYLLHVVGDTIKLENPDDTAFYLRNRRNDSGDWLIGVDANNNFQIREVGIITPALFFGSDGNFAIGSDDPGGDKLKVAGDLNVTQSITWNGTQITSTAAEINKLDGFTGDVNVLNYASDLYNINVSTTEFDKLDGLTASTSDLSLAGRLDVTAGTLAANKAIVVNNSPKIDRLLVDNISVEGNVIKGTSSDLNFYEGNNNISYGMTVDGGSANIGIGASNPTAPLFVVASSEATPDTNGLYLYNPSNSSNQHAILAMDIRGSNTTCDPIMSFDVNGVTGWVMGIDHSDSQKFKIANNWRYLTNNTKLTVQTDGNVGLGTTTPDMPFTLQKSGCVEVGIAQYHLWGSAAIEFTTRDSSNTQATRLTISGNTTTSSNISFLSGAQSNNESDESHPLFYRVGSTGYVGIGTNNPSDIMQVLSPSGFDTAQVCVEATTTNSARFRSINANADYATGLMSNNQWMVKDIGAGQERLVIDNTGNVGLGDSSPSFKFEVSGTMRANKYVVQNTTDGTSARGIMMWEEDNTNWGIYMATAGSGKSLAGGTTVAGADGSTGFTSHAIRFRANNNSSNGFIFENKNEERLMSIRATDGLTDFPGTVKAAGGLIFVDPIDTHPTESGWLYRYPLSGGQVYFSVVNDLTFRDSVAGDAVQLDCSGDNAGRPYNSDGGSGWKSYSDIRIKKDIRPFRDGLDKLRDINPVCFKYTGKTGLPKDTATGEERVGIIAQEMQKVLPYTVSTVEKGMDPTNDELTDILTYDAHAVKYVMVNAIKELDQEIRMLKEKIKERKEKQKKK